MKIASISTVFLAGALLTFAFAPFSIFPLAMMSPALLLLLWQKVTPHQAFWRGWLFGLGFFSTGVYWVFISIHFFGNTSVFLACFITIGFIALLALFPAINGYLLNRYFPYDNATKNILAFPALWVLLEWVRGGIFTGFPWLFIGTSQVNTPLKNLAPLFGVYGVSLAVLICSGLLVNAILAFRQKKYKPVFVNLLALGLIWLICALLHNIQWTQPKGFPIQVSLVQGNIEQELKWNEEQLIPTLQRYQELTERHWDSKIIIWPENAIPLPLQEATHFIDMMGEEAKKHNATIITGIPAKHATKEAYYNAVIAIGHDLGYYLKQRLVPFGEYTPLPRLLVPVLDYFNIPNSVIVTGEDSPKPLVVQGLHIAPFICYEIAFPELVLQRDGKIDLILTVSNDAWFGHSIASAQHLEMAQMRAIEMGRPVLFVSNTGLTAMIKPDGHIQSAVSPFQATVLTDKVQIVTGSTLWHDYGRDPILIILCLFIFYALRSQKNQRNKSESTQ